MEQEPELKKNPKTIYPSWIPLTIGFLTAISFIFIIYYVAPLATGAFDQKYHANIDKKYCQCGCFDGLNKGRYGKGGYKSIYFNTEPETLLLVGMWFLYFFMFVRTVERLVTLLLERKLSIIWLILLLCSIQPTFYGMWTLWNYINDRIFHLFFHQIYFSVTEWINFVVIYQFLDKSVYNTETGLWCTFVTSLVHIIQSVSDQGLKNMIYSPLDFLARDAGFLIGDIPLCIVSAVLLHHAKSWLERFQTQRTFLITLAAGMLVTILFLSNVTYGG